MALNYIECMVFVRKREISIDIYQLATISSSGVESRVGVNGGLLEFDATSLVVFASLIVSFAISLTFSRASTCFGSP